MDVFPNLPTPFEFRHLYGHDYRQDHQASKLEAGFKRIPRYLFRVYDANSQGATSTHMVWSAHAKATSNCDMNNLLLRTDDSGPSDLYNHLDWKKFPRHSTLVSWTSSLLFATQLGLYKHTKHPLAKDFDDLSNIFILMIDTSEFPKGTFIQDAVAMDFFRDQQTWKKEHEAFFEMRFKKGQCSFYFGEYLAQGLLSVEGKCSETSLQKLVDLGLFQFCPYFEDKKHWCSLASRVVQIRRTSFAASMPPCSYQLSEQAAVRRAVTIGQACFGDVWALPFALMILACTPMNSLTDGFFAALAGIFSREELDEASPDKLNIDAVDLIELGDYQRFAKKLRRFRLKSEKKKAGA
ncbi:hypothetical protein CGLO_07850 [Colletotrichum gloeosporioides Cg-14]|uniref:DUF7587 domain-containing protein n=1 Tax=Colletotrichum gloeosporioides (strain Cg-14) TaxID=1237896 RepID=T0LVX6_COLGC|nr:hypothetical protein CGLO_07850 [Colletotrichum gloeosporioides Cg-14]